MSDGMFKINVRDDPNMRDNGFIREAPSTLDTFISRTGSFVDKPTPTLAGVTR